MSTATVQQSNVEQSNVETAVAHANVYEALAAAQGEIGGVVQKNATNPHFKSSYADLGAILALSVPILSKHGLCLLADTPSFEDGLLHVKTSVHHGASGTEVSIVVPMPLGRNIGPQGFGSALTYGRRYGSTALLGIAQADDDGNSAQSYANNQRPNNRPQQQPRQQYQRQQQRPQQQRPQQPQQQAPQQQQQAPQQAPAQQQQRQQQPAQQAEASPMKRSTLDRISKLNTPEDFAKAFEWVERIPQPHQEAYKNVILARQQTVNNQAQ